MVAWPHSSCFSAAAQFNPLSSVTQLNYSQVLPDDISAFDFHNESSVVHGSSGARQTMPHLYNAKEGFILRFDFLSQLPVLFEKARVNYGIFRKGDKLFAYRMSKECYVERESNRTNKCIMLHKEILKDIISFPDTVLYLELWAFESDIRGNSKAPFVLGWSALELFDVYSQLKGGKWRLPFYSKNDDYNLLFTEGLPAHTTAALFMRISQPLDPFLDMDNQIFVEEDYVVPELHAREKKTISIPQKEERTNQAKYNPIRLQMPLVRELDDAAGQDALQGTDSALLAGSAGR